MSSWNVTKTRTPYRLINGYYKFSMKLVGDELETIQKAKWQKTDSIPMDTCTQNIFDFCISSHWFSLAINT